MRSVHRRQETCSIYQPRSGPTFDTVVQSGNLRVSIPGSDVYDHWSFVDSAPQVRLRVPAGNWEMTAKLKVNRPATLQAYHTGLMVYFSQFDLFYWELYRDQEVRLDSDSVVVLPPIVEADANIPNVAAYSAIHLA